MFKKSEYFSDLPDDKIGKILDISEIKSYDRGTRIFSEGEIGKKIFLTLTGKVKIFKMNTSGKEFVMKVLKNGDFFAESLLFQENEKYPATAEIIDRSNILEIDKIKFEKLLKEDSDIATEVIKNLSKRISYLSKKFENIVTGSAIAKAAFFLTDLAKSQEKKDIIELDTTREVIANMLNLSRESFERALGYLENEGVIKVKKREILIIDHVKLRDISFKA